MRLQPTPRELLCTPKRLPAAQSDVTQLLGVEVDQVAGVFVLVAQCCLDRWLEVADPVEAQTPEHRADRRTADARLPGVLVGADALALAGAHDGPQRALADARTQPGRTRACVTQAGLSAGTIAADPLRAGLAADAQLTRGYGNTQTLLTGAAHELPASVNGETRGYDAT